MAIPVLHIITRMIVGGAQENTLYTARLLDKNKYNVTILSGTQTGPEGSLIPEIFNSKINLKLEPYITREINPIKDAIAFFKIFNYLKRNNFVIVHTHSSKTGIIGRVAAHFAGVPIIIHTVHGWSFHDYMHPLKKFLYITLERIAANFSAALIAVSRHDIQKGLNANIGKPEIYHLIRSAIPIDEFNPDAYNKNEIRNHLGILRNRIVIGYVGRLSPQKNPLDWVKCAELIYEQRQDITFHMVGDGPLRKDLENYINDSPIRENIIFENSKIIRQ